MDIAHAWVVIAITWLAVISPGADFAVVSRNSSIHGRSAGIASSVGIASGCFVHVGYAIVGLAVISQLLPDFFLYIQVIGAVYLGYLGISLALSAGVNPDAGASATNADRNALHFFGMGLLTNSLNPKTSLFVVSLYSQVIGPDTLLTEKLLWGAFIAISHFLWFGGVSVFMSAPAVRSKILANQRPFNVAIGLALVALGVLLLTNDLEGIIS